MSALVFDRVSKSVRTTEGPRRILHEVNLHIEKGRFVALTGRSGAGKSTLLSIAGGLDAEYEGTAAVHGHDWRSLQDGARARQRNAAVGFVLQIPRLFSHLSVWQNLTAPAWIAGHAADTSRGEKLLARVGLGAVSKRAVSGLSGGERQRLTVARALINKPTLLLCDEPTGNLDRQTGGELLDLLVELQKEEALTIFVVTHDQHVIARADTVLTIKDGALV